MIVRVTRGSGMTGLVQYLAGPGKRNEHTDPHLVAGDGAVMAWWDDTQLNRPAAAQIGAHLDEARRLTGTEIAGGHVWHASLALPAADGQLSDQTWAAITTEFVESMDFTGTAADAGAGGSGGRAPCRWAAVRHGVSAGGNDHVHVVVSLVRDDGTKADTWRDYARASTAAAELEARHGLTVIESRALGRGSAGVTGAEHNKAARLGQPEPARAGIARTVRAAAVASRDEAEFIRRARVSGLLVRPRFAAGTDSVVVGYSTALRPPAGERPVWFGGGRLDRDLTLPRLREAWPDTPAHADAAVAEWTAAARHHRPVTPGRETRVVDPRLLDTARADLTALRERLAAVPVGDTAAWSAAAHDAAGMCAAMSARVEPVPGPLARAADQLARSAQHRTTTRTTPTAGSPVGAPRADSARRVRAAVGGASRVAAYLLQADSDTPDAVADAVLLRQLALTAKAIHDAARATGDLRQARALARTVRADLVATHPAPAAPPGAEAAVEQAAGVAVLDRPLPPPVPAGLDPEAAAAARALAARTAGVAAPTGAGSTPPAGRPVPRPGADRDRDLER